MLLSECQIFHFGKSKTCGRPAVGLATVLPESSIEASNVPMCAEHWFSTPSYWPYIPPIDKSSLLVEEPPPLPSVPEPPHKAKP